MKLLNNCKLCPRECNIDRNNMLGFCKSSNKIKAARAALHYFEEPCISGTHGSGTVFFSGCNLKCIYCQNYEISTNNTGKEISIERLSEIFLELQDKKANNINLVTPTHFVPLIIESIKIAKRKGLIIPIVYNTNSYENVETIKLLDGFIDIYLPDLKYFDDNYAISYSNCKDYFKYATKAINEMIKQVGLPIFDDKGIMQKGVIIRHLILPGLKNDSKKIIKFFDDNYKDKAYLSIMNQYTPLEHVEANEVLNKKITESDYEELVNYAINLGIENGYIQEGKTQDESFIPDFNNDGI